MARVLIPTALAQYAGGADEVEVVGGTVGEVLDRLSETYPDLKKQLFNEKGELRQFVNVYKGSDDTRRLQGLATPVGADDELSIVPSIAGGVGAPPKPTSSLPPPVGVIDERRAEAATLSNDEILRYSRHLMLPEVNLEGQKK